MEKFDIEVRVVEMLRTVFDPEIPVNVYDLGLIYKVEVEEKANSKQLTANSQQPTANSQQPTTFNVNIDMTLTAPSCPAADFIIEDIRQKVESIEGVDEVDIELVFEPEWTKDMMSEEARLDLGL
ncbi:MAG: metal-sulfur cluster assembly factor [Bacteroidaceae bacterium]|nr:metal-sulfur cluster assembly factor [Bacteroidaceae bacterium]